MGENITQGSIGGALISTANLDFTVNMHFKKSSHEISYADARLQPLIFQDDLFRICSSPSAAQAGNRMIEAVMESKLLDLNIDKSCYIVIGGKKTTLQMKTAIEVNPLVLCGNVMKEKVCDKYLGDYVHSLGTQASVHCTISNRFGRISTSIKETRAVIDDCRVKTVGGLVAGIDIWELAILPSLLNNCQTWINIGQDSIDMLEDLQNTLYRTLLSVPRTCPRPSLCWDMGGVQMYLRIIMKKLEFIWHLVNLEERTLAKEILEIQRNLKLPGLVKECSEWINQFNLPDVLNTKLSKQQWKNAVKTAIYKENKGTLKAKMLSYEKLKNSEMIEEDFETKEYVKNLNVHNARIIFKKRSSMTQHVKLNYMSDARNVKTLWQCDSCQSSVDSMGHVLRCPSYLQLRTGKDLDSNQDLAQYLHDVFMIRSKLNINM